MAKVRVKLAASRLSTGKLAGVGLSLHSTILRSLCTMLAVACTQRVRSGSHAPGAKYRVCCYQPLGRKYQPLVVQPSRKQDSKSGRQSAVHDKVSLSHDWARSKDLPGAPQMSPVEHRSAHIHPRQLDNRAVGLAVRTDLMSGLNPEGRPVPTPATHHHAV